MKPFALLLLMISIFYGCNSPRVDRDIRVENPVDSNEASLFLPGQVNTELFEMNSSYSKTGDEFYFSVADPFQNFNAILSIKKQNDVWSDPEVVSFSGMYSDFDPFISTNSNRMYFCSRRPLFQNDETNDANIWFVEQDGDSWSEPKELNTSINSGFDEYYVSVSERGTVWFSSTRPGGVGSWDIYFAEGDSVINPGSEINSEHREWDPFISPDEKYLIFTSDREGGFGGGDLYICFKGDDGIWMTPKNMGNKVNTTDYEYCPYVSRDGQYLYFSRFGGSSLPYKPDKKRNFKELKARLNSTNNGLGSIYKIKTELVLKK